MARPLSFMGTPESDKQRDAMLHRVRVGITGLATVFLLTLLAASVLALLGQDNRAATAPGGVANLAAAEMPKEPLAELGVAPGNAPKTPVGNMAAPTPPNRPRKP